MTQLSESYREKLHKYIALFSIDDWVLQCLNRSSMALPPKLLYVARSVAPILNWGPETVNPTPARTRS